MYVENAISTYLCMLSVCFVYVIALLSMFNVCRVYVITEMLVHKA